VLYMHVVQRDAHMMHLTLTALEETASESTTTTTTHQEQQEQVSSISDGSGSESTPLTSSSSGALDATGIAQRRSLSTMVHRRRSNRLPETQGSSRQPWNIARQSRTGGVLLFSARLANVPCIKVALAHGAGTLYHRIEIAIIQPCSLVQWSGLSLSVCVCVSN
jgi:hypothetical protein